MNFGVVTLSTLHGKTVDEVKVTWQISGILGDKTLDNKLQVHYNYNKQSYHFSKL